MKITIDINYTLIQAKIAYREHFNLNEKVKVTKEDLSIFLSSLVEADLDSIITEDDDESY